MSDGLQPPWTIARVSVILFISDKKKLISDLKSCFSKCVLLNICYLKKVVNTCLK